MATDVEDTDTDDHEKPGPAKRQRIVVEQASGSSNDNNEGSQEEVENPEDAIIDEEEDRRAREKLRSWQACQVAKGFVDNTINRVLENYIMSPPASYAFEDPWYRLFRGNQMEDTAVAMAIRSHGISRCLDLTQSPNLVDESNLDVPQSSSNTQASVPTNSLDKLLTNNTEVAGTSKEGDWFDEIYDSDHPQNFLDRAVAEAIKKKGLSTLSVVDYG